MNVWFENFIAFKSLQHVSACKPIFSLVFANTATSESTSVTADSALSLLLLPVSLIFLLLLLLLFIVVVVVVIWGVGIPVKIQKVQVNSPVCTIQFGLTKQDIFSH